MRKTSIFFCFRIILQYSYFIIVHKYIDVNRNFYRYLQKRIIRSQKRKTSFDPLTERKQYKIRRYFMTRKGENIFKRKDGRWEIRVPIGRKEGKTRYKFLYADSYAEAKQKKLTALNPVEKKETAVPFPLVAEEFLKKARLSLKESSYSRYHRLILSHITPFFKETLFCDLNNFTVSAFSLALSEKHSPKTVFCILILLKEIIRFGEKNGIRCDVKEIV